MVVLLAGAAAAMAPSAVAEAESGSRGPKMRTDVSSLENDYNLSVANDGRILVFARSKADFTGAKIWVTERTLRGWSAPAPISFSDPRWRDSDPWLTPDGRRLYFVSDRPAAGRGDRHDLDIWRSSRDRDGRWTAPQHLGNVVNGKGEELGPELHRGSLYFATARKSGMGGLDIYAAEAGKGGFAAPQLLPGPINSAASESDFTLSRDGKTAIFWRQVGTLGLLHLSRLGRDRRWSEPQALPRRINAGPFNFTPSFSPDGRRLTFASTLGRPGQASGMADIYQVALPLASDRR